MDWVEFFKNALLVVLGGGGFKFVEFLISHRAEQRNRREDRADKKDEKLEALRKEFNDGLEARKKEGDDRFRINSEAIRANAEAIDKLIKLNEEQNKKFDDFTNTLSQTLDVINKNSNIMGEGVKSVLYDKITMIYNKCLSRCDGGAITSDEEANIEQLYLSYSGLGGNGEGKKMYKHACEMKTVTKEEADNLDEKRRQRCRESECT